MPQWCAVCPSHCSPFELTVSRSVLVSDSVVDLTGCGARWPLQADWYGTLRLCDCATEQAGWANSLLRSAPTLIAHIALDHTAIHMLTIKITHFVSP